MAPKVKSPYQTKIVQLKFTLHVNNITSIWGGDAPPSPEIVGDDASQGGAHRSPRHPPPEN